MTVVTAACHLYSTSNYSIWHLAVEPSTFKAAWKSAIMSPIASIPTETYTRTTVSERTKRIASKRRNENKSTTHIRTRIKSGVTPVVICSSAVSCACVVVAGCITTVLASPFYLSIKNNSQVADGIKLTDIRQITR